MHLKFLITLLFFVGVTHAQTAISGSLELADENSTAQKIYLYKLDLETLKNPNSAQEVAWVAPTRDGSFVFKSKYLSDQDAIYQLAMGWPSTLNNTLAKSKPFILSKGDSIAFNTESTSFTTYSTSNLADKEWKRLRDFERKLQQADLAQTESDAQRKGYIKDSLRILIVKLIGIQELEAKNLLDQDIDKNPEYYLALLDELKESDMPSSQYLFLEKKLAYLNMEVLEQKYSWSKTVNIALITIVLGLLILYGFNRKRTVALSGLSKQESTIKDLILEGKSNKEIASELFISLSTVKTHITNIYGKLKVANRQELVRKLQN